MIFHKVLNFVKRNKCGKEVVGGMKKVLEEYEKFDGSVEVFEKKRIFVKRWISINMLIIYRKNYY